ncbi:MAG: hypothetical protein ACIAQZ_00120 [Sedimentisphaeraceae bacterium JB056]
MNNSLSKKILNCCAIVCVPIAMLSFFSLISFFMAVTSQEAIQQYDKPLPEDWVAGAMNHGDYYKWWTISENMSLFILALIALLLSVVTIILSVILPKLIEEKGENETGSRERNGVRSLLSLLITGVYVLVKR